MTELGRADELAPENPRYAYVHALALNGTGDAAGALRVLADAHRRHPADVDLLVTLITINRDTGNRADALDYARTLSRLRPEDPEVAALLRELSPAP